MSSKIMPVSTAAVKHGYFELSFSARNMDECQHRLNGREILYGRVFKRTSGACGMVTKVKEPSPPIGSDLLGHRRSLIKP